MNRFRALGESNMSNSHKGAYEIKPGESSPLCGGFMLCYS